MKSRIFIVLASVLPALLFAACGPSSAPKFVSENTAKQPSNSTPSQIPSNKPADITQLGWELQSGARQKLADYKGKVVVLDFWATYCPPCLEEIPDLMELQNKGKAQGLSVIGLNVGGPEDEPKIPAFIKKLHIKYDLGYPEDDLALSLLEGSSIPQTFVFDRSGKLVDNFVGYGPQVKAGLDRAIQQALAN